MARGLCHLVLCATALLVLNFFVDWGFDLPSTGRKILLGTDVIVLLAVFYVSLLRALRWFDPVRVALQVERLYPQLQSILVSYVQLQGQARAWASPVLVSAMCRQAAEQARPLRFGKIVHFRALGRIVTICLVVVGAAVGGGFWQPGFVRAFAARMTGMVSDVGYPTRTIIESVSGNLPVQQGGTVTLKATAGGVIPEEGILLIRPVDGEEEKVRVAAGDQTPRGTRQFAHRITGVFRSFSYSFRLGDAVSKEYRVDAIAPPRIEVSAIIIPPYTGAEEIKTTTPYLEVLDGSAVKLRLEVKDNRPLAKAELMLDKDTSFEMLLSPDGLIAEAALRLNVALPASAAELEKYKGPAVQMTLSPDRRSAEVTLKRESRVFYGFRLTDGKYAHPDGKPFVYPPDFGYSIAVKVDQPPSVTLNSPASDEKGMVEKIIRIGFTAADDYGLSEAKIVYSVKRKGSKTAGPEQSKGMFTFEPKKLQVNDESYPWPVQESLPDLQPGDVVEYRVVVSDNRSGGQGPNIKQSEVRRLKMLSSAEYLGVVMEQWNQLLKEIGDLQAEEKKATEALRGIGDKE